MRRSSHLVSGAQHVRHRLRWPHTRSARDLARKKTGRRVTVLRDLDMEGFRQELTHANDPGRRYTVNFTRGPLFGRGGGHHSPIGALAEDDLVLVLDVNANFRPWLNFSSSGGGDGTRHRADAVPRAARHSV
ncbi:MAG: phytochelatin synthase family protein [Myxococcales bacterium]